MPRQPQMGDRGGQEPFALSAFLEKAIGTSPVVLNAIDVGCSHEVHRARLPDGEDVFVKVTDARTMGHAREVLDFLKRCDGFHAFARSLLPEPLSWAGKVVTCFEWRKGEIRPPESLDGSEVESLLATYPAAAERFARAVNAKPARDLAKLHGAVCDFARRHPLSRPLLRGLVDIDESDRTYRRTVVTHGDFQFRNYAFLDGKVSAIFDLDNLIYGSPVEDLAYTVAQRYIRRATKKNAKKRLVALLARMVAASPFDRQEWRIALNVCRLRAAAKRLEKHPSSPFIAFDVFLRDRPMLDLLDVVRNGASLARAADKH